MANYSDIIRNFARKKILVVGDLILDRYILGSCTRISPEAPVPVVLEEKSFYTPGGAANVAHNLGSLGAHVTQVGKIGNDFEGQILKRLLKQRGVDINGVFVDKRIPTTTKTRVMAQRQQIVRVDRERVKENGEEVIKRKILVFLEKHIPECDGLILSDYGKGLISREIVSKARDLALAHKKIIIIDPKVEHFGYYRHVTAITPNRKEAENAIRNLKIQEDAGAKLGIRFDSLDTDDLINQAGQRLLKYLELESLLITLGERGMRLFEKGKKPFAIKTQAKEVLDVSGAGDTVISVFTLALTAGATKVQAAQMANAAAGVVVGKLGTVPVTKEELTAALKGIKA